MASERHIDTDRELVDLVSAVLVDPNLHTDLRMRLSQEITGLLRTAHEQTYGEAGREVHERALEAHGDHIPTLLQAVLVDPNLHTDMRPRLYRDVSDMVSATQVRCIGRSEPSPSVETHDSVRVPADEPPRNGP